MIIGIYFMIIWLVIFIYFLLRNKWVFKISLEMVEEVYQYNMGLIEERMSEEDFKKNKMDYNRIPTYNKMLFKYFYIWDKNVFKRMVVDK